MNKFFYFYLLFLKIYQYLNGPVFNFQFFEVVLDYGADAFIKDGKPCKIKIRVENKYKIPASLNFKWYMSEEWQVSPAKRGQIYLPHSWMKEYVEIEFEIMTEKVVESINRFVIEIMVNGSNMIMLVPVLLLNGNYTREG